MRVSQTEGQLIEQLQLGQPSAFTALYDAYSPALFGVLIRLVGDQSRAEDLLQDAFVKIWTNIHRYDARQGRLFTWLLTITKNVAMSDLNRCRTRDKVWTHLQYRTEQKAYIPATDVLPLQSVFDLLAPKYGQILALSYQGYTKEEIAHQFNIPLGTVKTRYRTAIQQLKHVFSRDIFHYNRAIRPV